MRVTRDLVNNSILSLHLGIWPWFEGQRNGEFSQNGKLGRSCARVTKRRLYESRVRDHVVHLSLNVSSSTHDYCGCMHNYG